MRKEERKSYCKMKKIFKQKRKIKEFTSKLYLIIIIFKTELRR